MHLTARLVRGLSNDNKLRFNPHQEFISGLFRLLSISVIFNYVQVHFEVVCLFLARQHPACQGLLIHEVSISHKTTHHSR